jgi:hypothetical protein
MPRVTEGIIVGALLLILTQSSIAADLGSVCVAAIDPPNAGTKSLTNPSGGNHVRSYAVQIDNRPLITVASEHNIAIDGLSITEKHFVKVTGDGKNVTDFRFRFDNYSSRNLCLWFKPLYETWSLTPAKAQGKSCVCR